MKNKTKFTLLLFVVCFFIFNFYSLANDTITLIKTCYGYEFESIIATSGEPFTVNYGDGTIKKFIGTGDDQCLRHDFPMGTFRVTITGDTENCKFTSFHVDRADTVDLSKCPSIVRVSKGTVWRTLHYINTNNCINLEEFYISNNMLTELDLRDNIALKDLICSANQLTHVSIVEKKMVNIVCKDNRLKLSYLYMFCKQVDDPWGRIFGRQELPSQRIAVGDSVDFSDQKEFGGIKTQFNLYKGTDTPVPPEDYFENEGVITFCKSGSYKVVMTNASIYAFQGGQPMTIAPFQVIDFIPVEKILDVPTETVVGVLLNLYLKGTILPNNATYKTVVWSVKDAGTTGATIKASKLYTTNSGTAIITATIKDGSAIGTDYTQDFSVEVSPLSINNPTQELSNITIYPNPTNGELEIESKNLRINKIEVLDIKGKIVLSHPFNILSVNHRIDISNLNSGIYFIKVITTQGEIVKKLVKL